MKCPWSELLRMRAGRNTRRGYSGARPDVVRLIARAPERVLDVGCGAGITAKLIRDRYPNADVFGLEMDPVLAEEAREHSILVFEGHLDDDDLQSSLENTAPFDLIICADVLEHMIDPSASLRRLASMMAKDGYLITSLPNVRHISTFWNLGIRGRWPQNDRGIHDATHLHFYARRDIIELCCSAGFDLQREKRNMRLLEAGAWTMPAAKLLDFWPFRGFLTFQYLHLWTRCQRD